MGASTDISRTGSPAARRPRTTRRRRGWIWFAAAIVLSFGSVAAPGVAEPSALGAALPEERQDIEAKGAVRVTPEVAEATDLALVASSRGWTLDEARKDRTISDRAGVLQALFIEEFPDDFAGAHLADDPSEPPTFRFAGAMPDGARHALVESGLDARVVENTGRSLEAMHADLAAASGQLRQMGFREAAGWVDQVGGRVVLHVRRSDGLPVTPEEINRRLSRELRDRIEIEVQDDAALVAPRHTRGGNWMRRSGTRWCTSGWSVERISDGLDGVALAAHCEGINQFEESNGNVYSAPWRGEHIGAWGEVEWHTTTHIELAEFYASSAQIRDVLSVEPYNQIMVDESVCVYGRSSNVRNCSTDVLNTRVLVFFEWEGCGFCTVTADRLVHMDGSAGIVDGDSGGGWSWNNRAYGITFGTFDPDNGALWSAAGNLPNALGVRVLVK